MSLTHSKMNLILFLNCLAVILTNAANLLVYGFFGTVRQSEYNYIIDKCQKKIFQFLVLTVVLRNSIDIYKVMSLLIILSIWMLHWLMAKRTKGLIGEENRDRTTHTKLLSLYAAIITFDGLIAYIFSLQFFKNDRKIDDIYLMVGFEVCLSNQVLNLLTNFLCVFYSSQDCSLRPSSQTLSTRCLCVS